MNTKYIFLDIDGTLVGRDATVPQSAQDAICQARKNGHKVFICSGRCRCEMHENILSVPVDGIVGSAGAYVELDGNVLYHRPMTQDMNRKLLDYFLSRNIAILLETNETLYGNAAFLAHMERYIAYCRENGLGYDKALFDLVGPLDVVASPELLQINKIIYILSEKADTAIHADLGEDFTVVDSAIDLPGTSGEVSEKGMDKGNGIRIVAEHYGVALADTIGIGDGQNDMEMLKTAGIGIAMGNANPILKEIADYVTTDVGQDGIRNAFLQYGLI